MPLSGNIHNYADVRRVLDTAVARGGLRFRLTSPGKAISFRQRAYKFIQLAQAHHAETIGHIPGLRPQTPYDGLRLRLESCDVLIEQRVPEGEFLSLSGEPVDPEDLPEPLVDDADDLVELFRKQVDD